MLGRMSVSDNFINKWLGEYVRQLIKIQFIKEALGVVGVIFITYYFRRGLD